MSTIVCECKLSRHPSIISDQHSVICARLSFTVYCDVEEYGSMKYEVWHRTTNEESPHDRCVLRKHSGRRGGSSNNDVFFSQTDFRKICRCMSVHATLQSLWAESNDTNQLVYWKNLTRRKNYATQDTLGHSTWWGDQARWEGYFSITVLFSN